MEDYAELVKSHTHTTRVNQHCTNLLYRRLVPKVLIRKGPQDSFGASIWDRLNKSHRIKLLAGTPTAAEL